MYIVDLCFGYLVSCKRVKFALFCRDSIRLMIYGSLELICQVVHVMM